MIEAVIFDMDGLLVDSEPVWNRARVELLGGFGVEWSAADQLSMAGVHTDVWVETLHDRLDGRLTREQVLARSLDLMQGYYDGGEVPVLPGADEALAACARRYRVGLASGSPLRLIRAALRGNGWSEHFEALISSDELEHGKPAPDVYLEILSRMEVAADSAVVVEDSGAGIRAGVAAGAHVVAVPNPSTDPGREVLALADARIGSLGDLVEELEKLG